MLLDDGSIWRASALKDEGVDPPTIARALEAGVIERLSRGTYRIANSQEPDRLPVAAAFARLPKAVVCMLSAAEHHGLWDGNSHELWLAVPAGGLPARLDHPPARILQWRHRGAFDVGITREIVCGIEIAFTTPARTVVDLLRYGRLLNGDLQTGIAAAGRYLDTGGDADELLYIVQAIFCPAKVLTVLQSIIQLKLRRSAQSGASPGSSAWPSARGRRRSGRGQA